MSGAIEIFPKQFLGANYTQTVQQAVDTRGANFGSLQAWIDRALTTGEKIEVYVQHANTNDDASFVTVASWKIEFNNTTFPNLTYIDNASQFGRFLRLHIVLTSVNAINLRGVLALKNGT